ncbi:MAG TPA: hypothetical protein PLR76_07805 [Hyphomonas sp.]|nr:hypothetical protein [Hyphomonas sp.]MCB9960899.1 hypothetical protein [Hyphomonas sp.]MCB9970190.1 hypothetical protein [Hyphomonas sp.]HPE48284.1 hypothetical protein [Hyphomonas sp.]
MRSVFLGVSLCLLAGCATVSVIPGQATVTSGISQTQSALRTASTDYCDQAVEAGWVKSSGGLAGLADTLINGMSREQARADTYAARIGADKRAPVLVLSRIVKDTKDARAGLSGVSREARALLDQPEVTDSQHVASRADLMSYERALVRAQMAYRSFQSALGEVAARPELDVDTGVVDQELDAFAATIDDARDTANQLADKYASVGTAAS